MLRLGQEAKERAYARARAACKILRENRDILIEKHSLRLAIAVDKFEHIIRVPGSELGNPRHLLI